MPVPPVPSPPHWPQALALLDEALALRPPQREAWLARTAASQPDVMPLLHKLLDAHERVESRDVLATLPKLHRDLRAAGVGAAGLQIGPFELIEPLGRGGMGSVWRARYADGRLKRDVAVKLPAATDDPAAVTLLRERFARERDFLAQLQHPNIARLYDAGVSDTGQPFLAMEYVAGKPITEHCDTQRLPVKARLTLFLQVLDAVVHAHQQLVLHRDLKAGNVLVDERGQARLLDFGVARLLPTAEGGAAPSDLTERAGAAFTLGHAAPEQLTHGALSTATDVYALGVMLYHLLTGLSPYQPARDTRGALEDAVLLATPEAASARAVAAEALAARRTNAAGLRDALRGDLDVVLGKTLKKNPAERYPTVAALAQDLRHHLARQPISARADSVCYRTRLFVTRHRVAVAASVLAAVALLGSSGVALWQARVSASHAAQAAKEASRAGAAQKFFAGLLANADPEQNKSITALDRKVVDDALAHAERDFAAAPETLAIVLKQLADISARMGIPAQRLAVQKKLVALLGEMPAAPADDVVEARLGLATALGESPVADERKQAAPTLMAARDLAVGRKASDRLVVQALCQIADQQLLDSRFKDADVSAALAVAHAERTLANPHPNLSWAYEQRGVTSTRLGQLDAARGWYRKAMAVDATGRGRGKLDQLKTRANLANTEFMAGNYRAAKREALSAVEFSRAEFGDTGSSLTPLRIRAVLAAVQAGELDEAQQLVRRLLEADLASADALRSGYALYAKGHVAMALGDLAAAGRAFADAKPRLAADARWRRRLAAQTAVLKLKQGQAGPAHELLEPLLAEIRAEAGTQGDDFAMAAETAAVSLARQGRFEAARSLFEEACRSRRGTLEASHPSRVRCESYGVLVSASLSRADRASALEQQWKTLTQGHDDRTTLAASLQAAKVWARRRELLAGQTEKFPLLD